jgi:amino acid transporter
MRHKIAQILFILLGLFFAIGALNPTHFPFRATTAYILGTILGHVLFAMFAFFCFKAAKRSSEKAKKLPVSY